MQEIKTSELQLKVLNELYCYYDSMDGDCLFFRTIAKHLKIEERQARLACRALKRKGLAEHVVGLWNDDGFICGSGYRCTRNGAEFIKSLEN